jgi:hypothetical protein
MEVAMSSGKIVFAQFDRSLEELNLPEIDVLEDDTGDLMDHETFTHLNSMHPRFTETAI